MANQPLPSAAEQSLRLVQLKGLVERRIRDVETQLNTVCDSVFGAGEVIEFFSDVDKVKVRDVVQKVIENVIVTNIEEAYQKLHITTSKIVQAGFSDGIFRADLFSSIMGQANTAMRDQQQQQQAEVKVEQEADTETTAVPSNVVANAQPAKETKQRGRGGKKRKLEQTAANPSTDAAAAAKPDVKIDEEALSANRIVTVRLKCPVTSCGEYFNYEEALDGHMLLRHRIKKFRCYVKHCRFSFNKFLELADHRRLAHSDMKSWTCGECDKDFPTNPALIEHHKKFHVEGDFACGFPNCDFVSHANQKEVHRHYQKEHTAVQLSCSECGIAFKGKANLESHMGLHRERKPFICKWPECSWASDYKSSVVTHIRMKHFGLPRTKKEQIQRNIVDDRNPHDFVLQMG